MIKVFQWNISYSSRPERISEYFSSKPDLSPGIVCLEEVTRNSFNVLCESLKPDAKSYSLDLRTPGKYEGKNRRLGVAILVFGGKIRQSALLDRTVFPDRSLDCVVEIDDIELRIVTFHGLTGVGYKKSKSSNFAAIADFLEANNSVDFLCFDANEPKIDAMMPSDRVFWDGGDKGKSAALLLGSNQVHELSDAYLDHLTNTGQKEAQISLAVSHFTRGVPRRYDYIYRTDRWRTLNAGYDLETALEHTSDHAVVYGEFDLV